MFGSSNLPVPTIDLFQQNAVCPCITLETADPRSAPKLSSREADATKKTARGAAQQRCSAVQICPSRPLIFSNKMPFARALLWKRPTHEAPQS
jgi:hypothetical protein